GNIATRGLALQPLACAVASRVVSISRGIWMLAHRAYEGIYRCLAVERAASHYRCRGAELRRAERGQRPACETGQSVHRVELVALGVGLAGQGRRLERETPIARPIK